MQNVKQRIQALVANGETERALEELLLISKDSSLQNLVTLQANSYKNLKRNIISGVLSESEKALQLARINQAILEIIGDMAKEKKGQPKDKESPKDALFNKEDKDSFSEIKLFPAISGLVLVLIIIGVTIYMPNPTDSQYQVFRIVLSIAIAGLAAVIPGLFQLSLPKGITAGGALAVFAFVYLINPAGSGEDFDFSIFLENQEGQAPLINTGEIAYRLGTDRRQEKIDGDGGITIKQIPASVMGDTLKLELLAQGWQFENGKKSQEILLSGKTAVVKVEKDDSLCCLWGTVQNEQGEFLSDVTISLDRVEGKSKENGKFMIEIPREYQKEQQRISVNEKGYEIWTFSVNPANKEAIEILLTKKP